MEQCRRPHPVVHIALWQFALDMSVNVEFALGYETTNVIIVLGLLLFQPQLGRLPNMLHNKHQFKSSSLRWFTSFATKKVNKLLLVRLDSVGKLNQILSALIL